MQKNQSFGVDLESEFESASLHEIVSNSCEGYMDLPYGMPTEAFIFIVEQYKRFYIPIDEEAKPILEYCFQVITKLIDYWDPYILFWGISDVSLSEDWRTKTFFIDGDEVNPLDIETLVHTPGVQDEVYFRCMSNPGLDNLPHALGYTIEEDLFSKYGDFNDPDHDFWYFNELKPGMSEDTKAYIYHLFDMNENLVKEFFKVGAWASFLWYLSPEVKPYLMHKNIIYKTAVQRGVCLLHYGMPVENDYFRVEDRLPKSCVYCGIQSYCVELMSEDGHLIGSCESCANGGLEYNLPYVCGTKFCRYQACPNHPEHMAGAGAMNNAQRAYGQLTRMARGDAFVEQQMKIESDNKKQLMLE